MSKTIHLPGVQDNGPAYAVSFQGRARQAVNQARKDGSLSAVQIPDALAQRQAQARKQAHKIVSDAFGSEKKMDAGVQGIRDHSDSLRKDNLNAVDEIAALKDRIEEARKLHGIAEGSEEDRECGLSRSRQDFMEHVKPLRDRIDDLTVRMDQNDAVIRANTAAEREIRIERLKTDPIGDAAEQAEELLDEANKDMIGGLFEEAREHIDEEREKAEEAAEEKAEKEAEKQEQIDAVKERKVEQEALTEAIREVNGVLDKLKLLPEDIKGTRVDDIL